jgi:hypothetical protein
MVPIADVMRHHGMRKTDMTKAVNTTCQHVNLTKTGAHRLLHHALEEEALMQGAGGGMCGGFSFGDFLSGAKKVFGTALKVGKAVLPIAAPLLSRVPGVGTAVGIASHLLGAGEGGLALGGEGGLALGGESGGFSIGSFLKKAAQVRTQGLSAAQKLGAQRGLIASQRGLNRTAAIISQARGPWKSGAGGLSLGGLSLGG